jgi:hypothetical protein
MTIIEFNSTPQHGLDGPTPSILTGIPHLTDKDDILNKDYFNGRLIESFGLPIGLYHPVFNEFQRNHTNKQIEDNG